MDNTATITINNCFCVLDNRTPDENVRKFCRYSDSLAAESNRKARGEDSIRDKVKSIYENNKKCRKLIKDRKLFESEKQELLYIKYKNCRTYGKIRQKLTEEIDNHIYLYDSETRSFPIGLLDKVKGILEEGGYKTRIENLNKQNFLCKFNWKLNPSFTLRSHQQELHEIIKNKELNIRQGMISWGTGTGKTLAIADIIASLGLKTLCLFFTVDTLTQAHDYCTIGLDKQEPYLLNVKNDAGMLYGNNHNIKPLTFSTIQSATRNKEELREFGFDVILVDEAHHAASASYRTLIETLNPAYIFGFTGTAFRVHKSVTGVLSTIGENIILKGMFGKVIHHVSTLEKINCGELAPIKIRWNKIKDADFTKDKNWKTVYDKGIITHIGRNIRILELVQEHVEKNRIVLIAISQKNHGILLKDIIEEYTDYKVVFNSSATPKIQRKIQLQQFRDRKINVLIGTNIFSEGIDIPTLDTLICAGGLKSELAAIQRLGRSMRKGTSGNYEKKEAYVEEFFDLHHGLLKKHSILRMEALQNEGYSCKELEAIQEEIKKRQLASVERTTKARKEKLDEFRKAMQKRLEGTKNSNYIFAKNNNNIKSSYEEGYEELQKAVDAHLKK